MKNALKIILIVVLIILISFVGYKIFTKQDTVGEEKLVVSDKTVMMDLGDVLLLINDDKITNAIYYNFDGCYLLGDKKITNEDLESLLTITEILNSYNKLTELTIYETDGLTSAKIDSLLETKKYNVSLNIYTSLVNLENKVAKLNIGDIKDISKVDLITKLYDNSKEIKKEVNNSLELENMTHQEVRKYMIRDIDEIKLLLEDNVEYKLTKKMGKIDGNNRIYYCYEDSRCFIYDYVNDKKTKIFLDEKLMKLDYSYYLDYEVTYVTTSINGNLMCEDADGNMITINNYVKNTDLKYYKEYLKCAKKKTT